MFRPAMRLIAPSALRAVPYATAAPARRFLSTAPPTQKSRSWKSLAARIGIAGAVIYYYNTTDVFAEEPRQVLTALPGTEEENESLPTIEALALQRQQRKAELEAAAAKEAANAQQQQSQDASMAGGVEGLEEEAGQQGAFNPETGEINWDCPCLGGMADGPCGEQFKAAFSCFVYSTEEPKGMDCIDKFKDMQNCFREYPEVYGSELDADEEDEASAEGAPATQQTSAPDSTGTLNEPAPESSSEVSQHGLLRPSKPTSHGLVPDSYKPEPESKSENPASKVTETSDLVPTAAFDGTTQAADRK